MTDARVIFRPPVAVRGLPDLISKRRWNAHISHLRQEIGDGRVPEVLAQVTQDLLFKLGAKPLPLLIHGLKHLLFVLRMRLEDPSDIAVLVDFFWVVR